MAGRNWLRIHDRHGFPRRLPGLWSWPRAAVEQWIARGGGAPFRPANDNQDLPPDLAMARAQLEACFGIPQSA